MKNIFSALLLALVFALSGAAHASTYVVNSINDTPDAQTGDDFCGDLNDNCTLRAAVQEANAHVGADAITLPAGTYTLTIAGQGEDASKTGDLDITDNLSINGAGALKTIIDAKQIDRVFDILGSANVNFKGVAILNGSGTVGGAIRTGGTLPSTTSLTLTDCAVSGSSSVGNGGGIDHSADGTLTLTRVTISGCRAGGGVGGSNGSGGGVHANGGALTATNCTFTSSSAASQGGGVRVGVGKSATFLNCTLVQNGSFGSGGGGITNDGGSVTLKNTLLAFNYAFNGVEFVSGNYSGSGTSQGHNLSSDTTAVFLTAAGDINNVDPRLAPLANYGGPTETHALLGNSPAIDAGDNNGAPATDQRGVVRPQGSAVDIGAFELTQITDGCSLAVTTTNDGGPGSLRAAIDCANSTGGANTITVPAGTYKLTRSGADEDGNNTGDLDILKSITLKGAGAATTIIDGNALDRVFDIKSPVQPVFFVAPADPNLATHATISGVTVRNGIVTGNGGGIRSLAFLTLKDAVISGNTAKIEAVDSSDGFGGGVAMGLIGFFTQPITSLTVINCQFLNNTARDGGGLVGANNGDDTLSVTDSTFTGNHATSTGGGGLADRGLLVMSNCTFTNNVADFDNQEDGGHDAGGGFESNGGDSTLTNCTFNGNTAGPGGGGGFHNAGGNLSLTNCRFLNNKCGSDSGAGFENEGGNLVMTDCVVTGNISTSLVQGDNDGGGGFENEGGSLVMTRCTITNNSATGTGTSGEGGGGFENEGGPLTMTACIISGNTTDGAGGGINNEGGEAVITNCTISGNTAGGIGGGINQESGGSLTMTGCTISGNGSLSDGSGGGARIGAAAVAGTGRGGGLFAGADSTLTNCTLSGNIAAQGGGIFLNGGLLTLLNVTIADNQSNGSGGGGVFDNNDNSAATNTIIARNAGSDCGGTGITNTSTNSFDSDGSCGFQGTGNFTVADPKLAPLADNGGPTQTQALLTGSPAIDAGANSGAPTTDQRGVARPVDGDKNGSKIVDIGAFEASPSVSLPTLSVNDVTVTEGTGGTKNATFTLTLSKVSAVPVSATFRTVNNEAFAPDDFTAVNKVVTIPAGQTTATVNVPIAGDNLDESNELFTVALTNPSGATLARAEGNGTIVDDDTSVVSINDVSQDEGNSGTKNFVFTISLSNPSAKSETVNVQTLDDTAEAGSDYIAFFSTVTFAAGETSKTVTVKVNGDTTVEPDETFTVLITPLVPPPPGGAKIRPNLVVSDNEGTGTIVNDDQVVVLPTIRINNGAVTEGNAGTKNATFTVTLSAASNAPVTVKFATANGTATAASDYTARTGTLTFAAGQTTRSINVVINGDTVIEPDETFFVNLSSPQGATIADNRARGLIRNDDSAVAPRADLKVTQTVNPTAVAVGQTAKFTITVTNSGPSNATSVVLNDTLPSGAQFLSASPAPASNQNGVLRFNLGTLNVGQSRVVTVTMRLNTPGQATNTAIASSPISDPAQANNTAAATTPVGPLDATPQITITASSFSPLGGYIPGLFTPRRVGQTLTLRNNGPALRGPVSLVLSNLSSNAHLDNAAGKTTTALSPAGRPYVSVPVGADNILSNGESVTVRLDFSVSGSGNPTYTPTVIAGPGAR